MKTKLFVGNLAVNTTESELQATFAAHGTVSAAKVIVDRTTGLGRGFGFVTMGSPEEARKALTALNGTTLGDSSITVNEVRPKENRAGGAFQTAWSGSQPGGGRRTKDRGKRWGQPKRKSGRAGRKGKQRSPRKLGQPSWARS